MDVRDMINRLYMNDTSSAYALLLELEALSDTDDRLYGYFSEFLTMTRSEKYTIRVRGFRLACKQAKWDKANQLNEHFERLVSVILGEKRPTALRQYLVAFGDVVRYKRELWEKIEGALLSIDLDSYKDTMRPLIWNDIQKILHCIEEQRSL